MSNLIVNGGFSIASTGTTAPGADGDTLLPGGSTAIDGWTVIGGPGGDDQLYWFGSGFNGLTSPGADAVAFTGDINKEPEFGVEQTIATTPGTTYALTFDVGTSSNYPDPSGAGVSVTAGSLTTTITGITTTGTDVGPRRRSISPPRRRRRRSSFRATRRALISGSTTWR